MGYYKTCMRKIRRERVAGGREVNNRMVVAKGPMCRVRTTNQLIMAQPGYTVQYTTFRWFTSLYSFILRIKLYDLKTEVNQSKIKLKIK